MAEDTSGSGIDYTGEMQLNIPRNGSACGTDRQAGNSGAGTAFVSQDKNLVWIGVSSVEEKPLDSISDNETLQDISSMNTETDMATINFSRGEQNKIEMKIQFKKRKDSSGTSPEEMKDICVETLRDILGQDVIADIEKILGVQVENVREGSIVFELKLISPDFIQKFNEAKQNGELEKILIRIRNLCQTKQRQTFPEKTGSITAKQSSHPSVDAISGAEMIGAPCPGLTNSNESREKSKTSFYKDSSIEPCKNLNTGMGTSSSTVSPTGNESDQKREESFIKEPTTKSTKINTTNTPCHFVDFIQIEADLPITVQEKRMSDMQKKIQAAEPTTDFSKELLQLNKERQKILLTTISKKLSEEYGQSIISTWAGTETTSEETVLVCLHSRPFQSKFSKFHGFHVKYREFDKIERESVIARTSPENKKAKLSEEDITLINNAIKKHGDELFSKHSNLEAISSSAIVSSEHGRKLSQKICIVLYCRVKGIIPFGESAFPRCLYVGDQTIDVDIREGYFYFYAFKPDPQRGSPQRGDDVNQVLRMGCSIGTADCKLKGTLGPFVRIDDDNIGFLTCAHVLGDLSNITDVTQLKSLEVVQPSNLDYMSNQNNQTDRVCGVIQEIQFSEDWEDPVSKEKCGGVDAALIRITSRAPSKGEFAWIDQKQLSDAGFGNELPVYKDGSFKAPLDFADCGTRIVKCGASTGLRRGTLSTSKCWVKIHQSVNVSPSLKQEAATLTLPSLTSDIGKSVTMKNLIHVDPVREVFFELGDSGAGVFMADGANHLTCIGLAIGCLSDYRCVMTPIDRVLKALGLVKESLMAFHQESMETDN